MWKMGASMPRAPAISWLVCVAVALIGPTAWAADAVQAQPVAAGAWFVQGEAALGSSANRNYISNAGFIVTSAGVVVIDALGSPALAEELLAAIRKVTSQPVRYVIVKIGRASCRERV